MSARRAQRGVSLVELMVGMAVGMVIVAAALLTLVHHLRENRSLLTEARLMQDLRTSSELIARDLRRAGYGGPTSASVNPYTELTYTDDSVRFAYFSASNANSQYAYRLHDGVIDMKFGDSPWQAMTDSNTLRVTAFSITPQVQHIVLDGFCSQPCPSTSISTSTTCPPQQDLRSVALRIVAQAAHDPAVNRQMQTTVRLRNDVLSGACPA